uniref:Uncharacterized protein n=1 Tax=Anopheles dirus TaxID=7168 RepID=A0A182NHA9_9DIPT
MVLIEGQLGGTEAMHDILFDVALRYTGNGIRVVFFRKTRVERVSDYIRNQFSGLGELFKMIIFMYVPTVEGALKRIMDLQSWENCIPGLLIFESFDLLGTERPVEPAAANEEAMISRRTLLLSALADTVRTISVKNKRTCNCIVTTSGSSPEAIPYAMFFQQYNVLQAADILSSSDILKVMTEMQSTINQQFEQESSCDKGI